MMTLLLVNIMTFCFCFFLQKKLLGICRNTNSYIKRHHMSDLLAQCVIYKHTLKNERTPDKMAASNPHGSPQRKRNPQ